MSINIIFAFFSIFIGNKTTNLENMNEELVFKIKKIEEELNINQIELAIYNANNYLRYKYYTSDILSFAFYV